MSNSPNVILLINYIKQKKAENHHNGETWTRGCFTFLLENLTDYQTGCQFILCWSTNQLTGHPDTQSVYCKNLLTGSFYTGRVLHYDTCSLFFFFLALTVFSVTLFLFSGFVFVFGLSVDCFSCVSCSASDASGKKQREQLPHCNSGFVG